jgi:hypothetical protein
MLESFPLFYFFYRTPIKLIIAIGSINLGLALLRLRLSKCPNKSRTLEIYIESTFQN